MFLLIITFISMQMTHQDPSLQPCKPGKHCTSREIAKAETKSNPILQENLNNGHLIRLSDNSLWEINPKDTPITQSWITPVEIIATPSQDPNYPYQLTNSLTKSTVLARRVENSSLPTPSTLLPTRKQ